MSASVIVMSYLGYGVASMTTHLGHGVAEKWVVLALSLAKGGPRGPLMTSSAKGGPSMVSPVKRGPLMARLAKGQPSTMSLEKGEPLTMSLEQGEPFASVDQHYGASVPLKFA